MIAIHTERGFVVGGNPGFGSIDARRDHKNLMRRDAADEYPTVLRQ
jgi:hypothetical protein